MPWFEVQRSAGKVSRPCARPAVAALPSKHPVGPRGLGHTG